MSVTDTFPAPTGAGPRQGSVNTWALVDMALLCLVICVSAGFLSHLRPVQSLIWLLCYALTMLRIGMLWPYFSALILRNRLIFVYPLACMASVLWSLEPKVTLISSLQLTMTFVIATYLGSRYSLVVITKVLLIFLSLAVVLSMLHWATGVFPWPRFSRVGGLVGIFTQKNMLGQRALFCAIIIFAVWLMPRRQVSNGMKLSAIVVFLLCLPALLLSQSITAILLMPVMLGFLALICIRRIPKGVSATVLFAGVVIAAIAPVIFAAAGTNPVEMVLGASGKDTSLTGRTELWHVAREISAEYPILGVGYRAFWIAPEFFNERLMTQHAGATTSTSFHNFLHEIRVGGGLPTVLAVIGFLATTTLRLWFLFIRTGSVVAACGITLVAASIVVSLLTPSLIRPHEFIIVVLTMYAVSAQEDWRTLSYGKEHFFEKAQKSPLFKSSRRTQ